MAVYTDNKQISTRTDKLTYTHNNDAYLNSSSYFRYKIEYKQTLNLEKMEIIGGKKGSADTKNISSKLTASIKKS